MGKRIRTSLEAKIAILMAGILFSVLLGVGHVAMTTQKEALYEAKLQQFQSVAQALTLTVEPLVTRNDAKIRRLLGERLKDSKWEMVYLVVADEQGKTIFAGSREGMAERKVVGLSKWRAVRKLLGYGGLDVNSIHAVTVPAQLGDGRWGTLTVGFSLLNLQELLYDVESRILLTFAVAMLIGVMCAVVFSHGVASALRSLIDAARAVARGDFAHRVSSKTNDEVGELADAYNYMIEALGKSHEQLLEQANADGLTGLHNHRYFQERLSAEFTRASRYDHSLSLLMLDIDRFKAFNDEHGHPVGDAVLCDMAGIINSSLRESDTAGRYGGEEFAIILPETSARDAKIIASRLRKAVEKHRFKGREGEIVPVTVSVGVAAYPDHAADKDQLLRAADVALYKAKSDGRNTVRSYTEEISTAPFADPYKLYVLLHANDLKTIEALASAVDAKNGLPYGYSISLATLATEVAQNLEWSDQDRTALYLATLLRDIGQIAVPDSILSKPEPLDESERSIIEQHPVLGHAIIQKSSYLQSVLPAVLHHHERFDGTGYPYGLAGADIPLAARLIAVVDAYKSMISPRPHRAPMTAGEAQMELARYAGSQFDPALVEAFIRILASGQKAA